jgi:ribosomal protein S18 acetylase RimI-like enzyme
MIRLRIGSPDDFAAVFPRTQALNAHEGIEIDDERLAAGLRTLLGDPRLGNVWLIERSRTAIGYAIVTYGYDLEFGGRDAYLTELWIDADARGGGAGSAVLELLAGELRARQVPVLHLQVRPDNPAYRLYARNGFVASPRTLMTRKL